jgi:SulP family sulfate permease
VAQSDRAKSSDYHDSWQRLHPALHEKFQDQATKFVGDLTSLFSTTTVNGATKLKASASSFPGEAKSYFKSPLLMSDVIAGLTVGLFVVPQGMSYALIAEMPPQYGLYGAAVAPLFYIILGRSGQLSIAASAITSLLVAEALHAHFEVGTQEYFNAAVTLALVSGVIQGIFAFFQFGALLSQFLSHTLISAFSSAAAAIIMLLQLKHILQVAIPRGGLLEVIPAIFDKDIMGETNFTALVMSLLCVSFLIAFKKLLPDVKRFPVQLFLVVVATAATAIFDLDKGENAIKTIGEVPASLPSMTAPHSPFSFTEAGAAASIMKGALVIALISYIESIAIGQVFRQKNNQPPLDSNKELWSLAIVNVAVSFFLSFPVTGGFSRSAINASAGAKTPFAGIVAAIVVILALTFLTPLFSRIPNACLGSIVFVAAMTLVDLATAKKLIKARATQWGDLSVWMITFILTLVLNVEVGVAGGVFTSFIVIIMKLLKVKLSVLGLYTSSSSQKQFRDVLRKPDQTTEFEGVVILRWNGDLLSFNASNFTRNVAAQVKPEHKICVMDMSSVNTIDSDGVDALVKLQANLGTRLLVAACKAPLRDALVNGGVIKGLGNDGGEEGKIDLSEFHETIAGALEYALDENKKVNAVTTVAHIDLSDVL